MDDHNENEWTTNNTGESLPLKSQDLNKIVTYDYNGCDESIAQAEKADGEEPPQKKAFNCFKLSRRNQWTFVLIAMGMFFNGCVFYFMVPFYTIEGVSRGVSETIVGLIFSVLHLVIFICSPLFGHFISRIGAMFMYVGGAFVAGFSTMIFSYVGSTTTASSFIVTSMLCRIMTAVGASAYITASFAILAHEFPDHTATVYSITESLHGVGFMVGPVIGGALYQSSGFVAPFLVVGAMMVWNGFQLYCLLPPPKAMPNKYKGSPFKLLRSSLYLVALLNIFASMLAIQFLDPTLAVRLQQFDLPTSLIGLGYLTSPFMYAAMSPLVGYLTDVKNIPTTMLMTGMMILVVGYLLIGPCPGLHFLPGDLWLVVVSTALVGVGFCCTIAPVMKFMIMGAVEIGFPHHMDTYGLVSGSFYSLLCAGGVAGNFMGGALMDKYGFAFAAMVVALIVLATNVITMIYFGCRRLTRHQKDDDIETPDDKHKVNS